MNTQAWNAAEIEKTLGLYENGFPCGEIAAMIGRTEAAVRYKLYSLGYSSRQIRTSAEAGSPETSSTTPAQEVASLEPPDDDSDYFRMRAERELEVGSKRRGDREKVEEAKRILLEDRIVDTFRRQLCDMPPRIEISAPPLISTRSADLPLTGVLVISDMHGGQVVDPRETEGLGEYNPAIMIARSMQESFVSNSSMEMRSAGEHFASPA